MTTIADAPPELNAAIVEFFPPDEWDHAAQVAQLESGFDAFALADTTTPEHPCGSTVGYRQGVKVSAERSVGYFQINTCNLPGDWEWQRLYNARHNAGTAHMLWEAAGRSWRPWYFSARRLGLL